MTAQMLMNLWPKIHDRCSDLNFRLVTFENTEENAREILKNLGQNIDVVTGFADELLMEQRGCEGLVIAEEPLCCAVSIYHPFASCHACGYPAFSGAFGGCTAIYCGSAESTG